MTMNVPELSLTSSYICIYYICILYICIYMCVYIKVNIYLYIWFWWSRSSSLGVKAPSAPTTTGTTLACTFHVLSSSYFSPWDFLQLLVVLLVDVAVAWNCYVSHHCLLRLRVCYDDVWSVGWPVASCLSGSGPPTGALPCCSPRPSEESPTWTWEGLVHT